MYVISQMSTALKWFLHTLIDGSKVATNLAGKANVYFFEKAQTGKYGNAQIVFALIHSYNTLNIMIQKIGFNKIM